MNMKKKLQNFVCRKFKTDEQKRVWWQKYAFARKLQVWKQSERQNHRCCYCAEKTWVFDGEGADYKFVSDRNKMGKKQMATADHFIPLGNGGSDHPLNIVMACWKCNQLRGDMDAIEFWEIMQDNEKLNAFHKARRDLKMKQNFIKQERREPKTNKFVMWVAYLCTKSPDFDQAFEWARTELSI